MVARNVPVGDYNLKLLRDKEKQKELLSGEVGLLLQ